MYILFPASIDHPRQVDELYQAEYDAACAQGWACGVFSTEDFEEGFFRPYPLWSAGQTIVYRGWMLSAHAYTRLHCAIVAKQGQPLTSPDQYQQCHYLPNWYASCESWTPKTIFCQPDSNFEHLLAPYAWSAYFVKDHVKSLTTSQGSVAQTIEQIPDIIQALRAYRGHIDGGICIREFEHLQTDTEERFFVMQGQVYTRHPSVIPPTFLDEVAKRMDSPFFSADVIQNQHGDWRLIELGDGQVSDYKKWDVSAFIAMITHYFRTI